MFNLINEQKDIGKIYLYANDLSESNSEYLIKSRENAGIKHINDSKALLNAQIQWMTFMKILMIIIQTGKEKS